MKKKTEADIETLKEEALIRGEKISEEIREDFVKHQTIAFAANKEVTKLLRDKLSIQAELEQAMAKIVKLERRLYG